MFFSNFRRKTLVQTALWNLREIADYPRIHPGRELRRRALAQSVDYLLALPALPPSFPTPGHLLKYAIEMADPKGGVVELGVFKGGTIRFIARHLPPDRPIHGFDTFSGLPRRWTGGSDLFHAGGKPPDVPPNVTLHVGLFTDTLPGWVENHPEPLSLLHVDCDLYESTKPALDILAPRVREGTVIVFDEYFNYPGWQGHEFKAFQEFVVERDVQYTYLGYSSAQMAVRIDQIQPAAD